MAWIKTIKFEEADEKLQKILMETRMNYPQEYASPVEKASNINESIVDSHTLIPDALFHAFSTFSALMSPELPLERRQHEMIATMVSVTNDCFYWVESHAEFLRRVTLDDNLIEALRKDYKSAPISEAEKVMCDYVVQLTKDATKIHPAYHEKLRGVGFDDTAILQITLIASWFNYINRVADALGIGREWMFSSLKSN